jgi:adenylosuccinate synthase
VDLGFGDAGKGSVVDFLARDRGADLIVRFNGGAQAGHNVVTPDGRHHTFSQLCAGAFAGVPGLLGPDFLLHPLALAVEAEHLQAVGVADPWAGLAVDRRARVITPYQQAAGRVRELLRGAGAHGTCGVGVGERVGDGLAHADDQLYAGDLADASTVRARLRTQRERKRAELVGLGAEVRATPELALFDDEALVERVVDAWGGVASRLRLLDADAVHRRIRDARRVVFEGAQGVLLDETWGFHPHTTWSDCTPAGALALAGDREVRRLGVIRAYHVRHGAGPFPTEAPDGAVELHNADHGWQGRFRVGALDGVLLRYAVEVCGGVDALAVTCLDRVGEATVCDAYVADGVRTRSLDPGRADDLAHRERLGGWLRSVAPELDRGDAVAFAEAATGLPVGLQSRGPTAADKRWGDQGCRAR